MHHLPSRQSKGHPRTGHEGQEIIICIIIIIIYCNWVVTRWQR